jgi:hypothetical protein
LVTLMLTEQEKHEILQRADEVLAVAEASECESAERRERIARGEVREWALPAQEPPPRATTAKAKRPAMTSNERNEILSTVSAMINQAIARREAKWADEIGKALAAERAKHREFVTRMLTTIEQRAEPDNGPVLDLVAERLRRRDGNAA